MIKYGVTRIRTHMKGRIILIRKRMNNSLFLSSEEVDLDGGGFRLGFALVSGPFGGGSSGFRSDSVVRFYYVCRWPFYFSLCFFYFLL